MAVDDDDDEEEAAAAADKTDTSATSASAVKGVPSASFLRLLCMSTSTLARASLTWH